MNSRVNVGIVGILAVELIFAVNGALAAEDASQILQGALDTEQNTPPYMMDIDVNQSYFHATSATHFTIQARQKADKFEFVTRATVKNNNEASFYDAREVWDGSRTLQTETLKADRLRATVMKKKPSMAWRSHAPFLYGVLDYGTEHYANMLLQSKNLQIRAQQEKIDGFACYVIEGDTPRGHYTVWLDPKNGLKYRKATVKEVLDHPIEAADGKTIVERTSEIGGIAIEPIDGIPTVVKVSKTVYYKLNDGSTANDFMDAKVSNVKWNPDFESVGGFRPNLPPGTVVKDLDLGIEYISGEDGLAPHHDETLLASMNEAVSKMSVGGKLSSASAPASALPASSVLNGHVQQVVSSGERPRVSHINMTVFVASGFSILVVVGWLVVRRLHMSQSRNP